VINRIVVLSTLIIAFALSINWVLEEEEKEVSSEPRNDPDLYMLNASINQFDESGELQHTIGAQRFTHFPLTDLTTMKSPTMSLASEAPTPWQITAKEGRILPASRYREEIVELWNNVLAEKSRDNNDFINIQTNSLTVYPEREYAETDEKVYIDSQTGRTSAAGMKAYLDTGRFMFFSTDEHRVTTIFLPN
jgi:lipopolysaccharide export system protein LptC